MEIAPSNVVSQTGYDESFTCSVTTNSSPVISWRTPGSKRSLPGGSTQLVPGGKPSKLYTNTLEIKKLTRNESGLIECRVTFSSLTRVFWTTFAKIQVIGTHFTMKSFYVYSMFKEHMTQNQFFDFLKEHYEKHISAKFLSNTIKNPRR